MINKQSRAILAGILVCWAVLCSADALGDQASDIQALWKKVAELADDGKYKQAVPLAEKMLVLIDSLNGREDPEMAMILNNVAEIYWALGSFSKAEPLYVRALAINEGLLGPDDPLTAKSLANLADCYRAMGHFSKAEPLYLRALAIFERARRSDHASTVTCLNNLAVFYKDTGNFTKAESLFKRALDIGNKTLGSSHSLMVASLNNLAELYSEMGEFGKAEPLYLRALTVREKTLGTEHPLVAASLNNLAQLYLDFGDFAKAESLFTRALAISETTLGPDHPDTASILDNLAGLYKYMGDFAKAEPLFVHALTIREKTLGSDHPDTATSINNLAVLYWTTDDYAKAEPLFMRALHIREAIFDPEHAAVAESVHNLAAFYWATGDFAKAEPLFVRALAIREKVLGPNHPDTAFSLSNLAVLYWTIGNYAKAEPLFVRALTIREKVLGLNHPDTVGSLEVLGVFELDVNHSDIAESQAFGDRAAIARESVLNNILSFASEEQRLAFQASNDPFALTATLGRATEIAQVILHNKGVVLDSLLEDRRLAQASNNPKQRAVVEQLRAAKVGYTRLFMAAPVDSSEDARQRREDELHNRAGKIERIESDLARRVSGLGITRSALAVTVEQVQGALASDQVLVEFLRYRHYLGKHKWEPRYGALLLTLKGKPAWIPLGAAGEIEQNIAVYRQAARGPGDDATLHKILRDLYEQLWTPIAKTLSEDSKTIILSPDGELNFVSFATLLNAEDKFLIQQFNIRYVASGRDLLPSTSAPSTAENRFMALFGNPNYAGGADAAVQQMQNLLSSRSNAPAIPPVKQSDQAESQLVVRASDRRDFGGLHLQPLLGTKEECKALDDQAEKLGMPHHAFLGADATEAQMRAIVSPRILHLATHGFFLPETKEEKENTTAAGVVMRSPDDSFSGRKFHAILKNPMVRSGVALAGAQHTLDAWARGEVPPPDNDGILTAEEVGGLDLRGTWLVTLSACDTGTGEARAGEGVLGLRRGFIQAGAQNLLMTLWPISDVTTVKIMEDFYAQALRSGNAPAALCEVQRRWLVKLRQGSADNQVTSADATARHVDTADEDARAQGGSLRNAVRLAGPFILNSTGN